MFHTLEEKGANGVEPRTTTAPERETFVKKKLEFQEAPRRLLVGI